jgi:hypothetical protein
MRAGETTMRTEQLAGARRFRQGVAAAVMLILAAGPAVNAATKGIKMPVAPKWSRFEQGFRSSIVYTNPLQEATLTVMFTSPQGEVSRVLGFWDGGRTWRVRFSPAQPGHWTFHTVCSDPRNDGLHHQSGEFMCTSALGQSRFDEHGLVQVSRDQQRLEFSDQTPFVWMADTAWSGARASVQKDWEIYTQIRLDQGYTSVLWVATPGLDHKREGPTTGFPEAIGINPGFFQRMDKKVAVLANAGVLSVIVPFSDTEWDRANGPPMADDQITLLIRYIVARWGADPVIWMLPTETVADKQRAWKEIGQSVFGEIRHAPVLVHVGSKLEDLEQFRNETWASLRGIQPLTSLGDEALKTAFAALGSLKESSPKPLIVSTPMENSLQDGKRLAADDIRHAVYWSWLMSGAVGLSYAANGVQNWDATKGQPGEPGAELPMWRKSMFLPGGKQMATLGKFMNSLSGTRLRPDPSLVSGQPGDSPSGQQIVAAGSPAKDLVLVYVPEERSVELNLGGLPAAPAVTWFNPRTGQSTPAVAVVSGEKAQFPTPAPGDWLLVARKNK